MSQWKDYELPKTAEINGEVFNIRTDYRVILDILSVLNDPELNEQEKATCCIIIFYIEHEKIKDYQQALDIMMLFINGNQEDVKSTTNIQLMDWEQDINLIIPPINKNMNKDIRELEYLHWWTFLGAYMEIGECTFSTFVCIRDKKAHNKKLEKYEEKIYKEKSR